MQLFWHGELCRFNKEGYHLRFIEKVYSLAPRSTTVSIITPATIKKTYGRSSYSNGYLGRKLWTFIDKFSEDFIDQIGEDMKKLIYRDFISSTYNYAKSKIFGVENTVPD